jgi:transcriptional regulator with XRE-family HTH domain
VDAEAARGHIQALSAAGVGWKRVAELAGVSTGAMSKLLYGGPGGRPPSQRIRPQTAAAILAVRPSAHAIAPGTLVGGTGTRRRVQALVARGWSQARLAGQLGLTGSNFAAMMRRDQVTAGTARAVRDMYDRLWNQAPPENGQRERIAAARARNYAAQRGWVPPLGWDDEVIDDPAAPPVEGWQRPDRTTHRSAELAQDARELLEGQGYTREHAAARLGVSPSALDRALHRARLASPAMTASAEGGYEAEAG